LIPWWLGSALAFAEPVLGSLVTQSSWQEAPIRFRRRKSNVRKADFAVVLGEECRYFTAIIDQRGMALELL
jgi:hypothetical protein